MMLGVALVSVPDSSCERREAMAREVRAVMLRADILATVSESLDDSKGTALAEQLIDAAWDLLRHFEAAGQGRRRPTFQTRASHPSASQLRA